MSLFDGRFMTMRLEDGEEVVRLYGGKATEWKSSLPHAGKWGESTSYVLVPCRTSGQVKRRAAAALDWGTFENRSGDVEVLLLGTHEAVSRLITEGPRFCRARQNLRGKPRSAAQIEATASSLAKMRGAK